MQDAALRKISAYHPKRIDATTVEIRVENGGTLTNALRALSEEGVEVTSMRNKANRLEEIFVNLITETA